MRVLNKYIIMVVLLSFFTESRESLMTIYTCVYRPYPGGVASILNIGKHFSLSFFFFNPYVTANGLSSLADNSKYVAALSFVF